MSKKIDEFVRLLKKGQSEVVNAQMVWASVESVDWDKKRMTAKGLVDNLEYYDVILGLGHISKKPKLGTMCLLGIIGNHSAFTFLVDAQEVEETTIVSNTTELHIKEDGFIIKKGSQNLETILSDFMDEVMKIIVINGTSVNVPALTAIKTRLKQLLK